jgi:hypothetical protein
MFEVKYFVCGFEIRAVTVLYTQYSHRRVYFSDFGVIHGDVEGKLKIITAQHIPVLYKNVLQVCSRNFLLILPLTSPPMQ